MFRSGAQNASYNGAEQERRDRLEQAFREYAPRVLDYARHRGATLSEAEDVVSEVFVVLTRRLDDVPDDVLSWLCGVARKVMCNQMRGKQRRNALSQRMELEAYHAHPNSSIDPVHSGDGDVPVEMALSMLSERDREALILVAWDDLSYEEAARSLGCTSTAFAQTLRRARRRITQILKDLDSQNMPDLALGESGER